MFGITFISLGVIGGIVGALMAMSYHYDKKHMKIPLIIISISIGVILTATFLLGLDIELNKVQCICMLE